MDGNADIWIEGVNSADVRRLFTYFDVNVPGDASDLSFAKGLLEGTKLTEFKNEMNSLANEVMIFRNLSQEDNIPGTVYVYEVNLEYKYSEGEVTIVEKNCQNWSHFFTEKNKNIVKIILIHSKSLNVIEAKEIVYKKYKHLFHSENFYVQHACEEYDEVSKLSGHRKVTVYTEVVESLLKSIPLDEIENIVNTAASHSLSKENITSVCFDAVIQESGSTDSDPYICRSFFTVRRLKRELVEKTLESVKQSLKSNVSSEIQRHIAREFSDRFNPGQFYFTFIIPIVIFHSMVVGIGVIAAMWFNPIVGVIVSVVGIGVSIGATFLFAVDVNSRSWRREVATNIYDNLSNNKEKVLKEISSNVKKRCSETIDQLRNVSKQLEDFERKIDLIDQDTEASIWEKRHVIKDKKALQDNDSIVSFIAGRENDEPVVKVFLRYPDKNAVKVFKDNLRIKSVTIADKTKEMSNEMDMIRLNEDIRPPVSELERNRLSDIIYSHAERLYANHSTIVGIGISNVRSINGNIIYTPCIVIYCSDKSTIPFGEKPLPTSIGGCICDIRENIILFGTCNDCGEENANPGCSVGMTFSSVYGSAGFLAKSNSTKTDETGFLTAAHVAIRKLEKLYLAERFLSTCNDGDESNVIVHPSLHHANLHSTNCTLVGEVIESYCGNYLKAGMDAAFVRNYKSTIRGKIPLQIADENDLKNAHGTLVRKKGTMTGETEGILVSGVMTFRIDNVACPVKYRFDFCYEIKTKVGSKQFFKPGDSGSGVYLIDKRGNKKALGIAFAYGTNGNTYACKIDNVTLAFDLSLYDVEEHAFFWDKWFKSMDIS